ncbi:subclass B3 metallo-beta-lactamase [Pseudoduganella sp. LjRoot289]|uniref:subclass B3 metallo-beta-lactamase n=1 Tax=Pseudoduganella sp. LjRoot289 TaxID=3342314 RepID=UPI003ECC99EF
MTRLKRLLLSAALAASLPLAPAAGSDWNDPQEPFAIFGNTYYVGPKGLSSVLITSPAGHILIDGGSARSPVQIAQHIRKLGYKLTDVKYILNSHEHHDHAGGIAELQRLTGAAVLASVKGESVLRTGLANSGDPQFADLSPFSPVANTRAVGDGETVTLGPLAVTAHYTPGHTQGGTSWTWLSTEGGKTASMVYADSLNALSAGTFRYSGDPAYPNARADLEQSIARVAALDCDILVSAHPEASDLWARKAKQGQAGNSAFIDAQGCRNYAALGRAKLERKLAEEAAKP